MPKSEISQASSQKSRTSQKSKMKSKPIEVDETLFGSAGRGKTGSQNAQQNTQELMQLTKKVREGDYSDPNVAVLNETEI